MSQTAVQQSPAHWVSPLSTPEVIDLDDALTSRCPRTKRTITDREDETQRRLRHHDGAVRKELAMQRRGKPELSEAQHRALFTEHPSLNLEKLKGYLRDYKLTKRERAQVKYLRKQWAHDAAIQAATPPALSLVPAS